MAASMVHVRVHEKVKKSAEEALEAMGLSVSDAVRILLVRIAAEQAFPFPLEVPNAKSRTAMKELDRGKGKRHRSVREMLAHLNK